MGRAGLQPRNSGRSSDGRDDTTRQWMSCSFICGLAPLKFFHVSPTCALRSGRKMPPSARRCAACVQMHMCYVRYVPAEQPTPTERWCDPWLFSSSSSSFGVSFISRCLFLSSFSFSAWLGLSDGRPQRRHFSTRANLTASVPGPSAVPCSGCWRIPRLLPLAGPLCSGSNRLLELISLTGVAKCSLSTQIATICVFCPFKCMFWSVRPGDGKPFFSRI
jgi:hypothetical protein